jgi:type IV secretory pathway VirB2 component (pilin)
MAEGPALAQISKAVLPEEFARGEGGFVATRRRQARKAFPEAFPPADGAEPNVGLALSGGGIRSATFNLGLLQGLAARKVLPRVDYLSTVSGGGYIGSWLGALIQRKGLEEACRVLTREAEDPGGREAFSLYWLRENSSYLGPRQPGDDALLTGLALRNWISVWVVLGALLLALFLAMDLRWLAGLMWPGTGFPHPGWKLWWSPWLLLPAGVLLLGLIPAGWAYWLVTDRKEARLGLPFHPAVVSQVFLLLTAGLTAGGLLGGWPWHGGASLAGLCAGLTLVNGAALAFLGKARWSTRNLAEGGRVDPEHLRSWLSRRLAELLVWAGVLTLLGMVDTLGQSVFAVVATQSLGGLRVWAAGALAALAGAASAGRMLQSWMGSNRKPVAFPVALLAGVAAGLLWLFALVGFNGLAHGLAFGFREPRKPGSALGAGQVLLLNSRAERPSGQIAVPGARAEVYLDGNRLGDTPISVSLPEDGKLALRVVALGERPEGLPSGPRWLLLSGALAMAGFLAFLLGNLRTFLNQSTLGLFYTRRLVRTFLGASNPRRSQQAGFTRVQDEVEGDDEKWSRYQPWTAGGPLHLVNVTINETVDGRSQIQFRDRKGTIMAVGPVGVSVGLHHHAMWDGQGLRGHGEPPPEGAPPVHKVFPPGQVVTCEPMMLGQWVGISGAAFGTGLGSRTQVGISALFSFFNVRTGYWWFSGIVRPRPSGAGPSFGQALAAPARAFTQALPVQAHLLEEALGRFPGTARRSWYLSDGGHFENTGVYELARRQVPVILLADCGRDEGCGFEDLANLTLKLRNDFGAELTFPDGVHAFLGTPWAASFTRNLEETYRLFRPGLALPEPFDLAWPSRQDLLPAGDPAFSRARFTVACIAYPGGRTSVVVLLKPSLTGEEPLDLLHYRIQHPDFPQQSTLDQFFDEAQWEAYRKLGEMTGREVFA